MSSASLLTCGSCGSEEPEGSGFCGNCGSPLAAPEPEPAEANPSETVTCASCGSEEPGGSGFCGNCGAPLVAPPETRKRRRLGPVVAIAALAIVAAGGAGAVVWATGAFGGSSTKSQQAFVADVNERVLGSLRRADETAAANASVTGDDLTRAEDAARIVRVSDEASAHLRGLDGLSARQRDAVQRLLAFVAANKIYGSALAGFARDDSQSQLALDGAASTVRATLAAVQSTLPTKLQLPSQATFISLETTPPPTNPTTSTTPVTSDEAVTYVQHVDDLLRRSRGVLLGLQSFSSRAASGAISRSSAVTVARTYLEQRQAELREAQALTAPPDFTVGHALLVRAFQTSVADDQALVAWAIARRDRSGNVRAALDRVNRIGVQATTLKRQFLRVYRQQRQAQTGFSPGSVPQNF